MKTEKDKRIQELEEENARLRQEKDKITQEKDKITQEKDKIEKEFKEFKAKHAITVDNFKRALKIKPSSKAAVQPVGARNGYASYVRQVPARIDVVKQLNPSACPHCKTLLGTTQEIRRRHVTDIQLISQAKTTKYEIHRSIVQHAKSWLRNKLPMFFPALGLGSISCSWSCISSLD